MLRHGLDYLLKGHILVRIGIQGCGTDLGEQVAEGGIVRQVAAQHQHVDEEADQPLQLLMGAVGDRATHGDILLAAVAGQQDLEGGQQRHKQRDPFALGEGLQLRAEVGRQKHMLFGALEAEDSGSGMIGGQVQW
ncbi:hypothetical protein KSC_090920 [Ktedonobacter sp. SOSP1-52]|nr:hypothetical protein KSC_090920 [Ktedonobacter sp. SOSP1-52]